MTNHTPEHINPALDLVDLIDAQDPPRMFYVPDSEGFEVALDLMDPSIIITIPRHRSPSATDLQFIKTCGERLRVRLAAAIDDHTPTP